MLSPFAVAPPRRDDQVGMHVLARRRQRRLAEAARWPHRLV